MDKRVIRRVLHNISSLQRLRTTRVPGFLKVFLILLLVQLIYYSSYRTQTYPTAKVLANKKEVNKLVSSFDPTLIVQKIVAHPPSDNSKIDVDELLNRYANSTSSVLENYIKSYKDVLTSDSINLNDKCDLFLYHLHSVERSNWDLESDLYYTPEAFDKESYMEDRKEEKIEELKKNFIDNARKDIIKQLKTRGKKLSLKEIESLLPSFQEELNQTVFEEFERKYSEATVKNREIEQDKFKRVSNLRIFGKCFFNDQYVKGSLKSNQKSIERILGAFSGQMCQYTEQLLFPFLSFKPPIYKRWTGDVYHGVPLIENILYNDKHPDKQDHLPEKATEIGDIEIPGCFLSNFRQSINGKGIVVSTNDAYAHELKRLIKVLRIMGNKLPIQVVHKGDLSEKEKRSIINYARAPMEKVLLKLPEETKSSLDSNLHDYIDPTFPVQELWFVDVKNTINPKYLEYFESFANKLLAYLFTSFDEIILMDTDTVPLVPTSDLFRLEKYTEHGALFFRDRDFDDLLWFYDSNLWKKLMPSMVDEKVFNIPHSTDFTLKNRYLGDDRRHFMEAGLVLMKRSTHFTGILMSLEINLWGIVSSDKVWGEKEFFWLGQSLAGNENYYFNANQAGAAGQITTIEDKISSEICSTHPAHVWDKDNRTLLWINSGFQNCKKGTWATDVYNEAFKRTSKNKPKLLKHYYEDFTRIKGVIVPPVTDYSIKNSAGEPPFGWKKTELCAGFCWCAYNVLGGSKEATDIGQLIEFDNKMQKFYEVVGEIWNLNV